ncbi:hypothetical protein ECDEC14B_2240 [Escherichia coli DEC14B]|nr:hypothetical protein ECDEC14B_2240 [Escherichia coli DEC14B]
MNIILLGFAASFPPSLNALKTVFQPFQSTPDNLHFKYHLLVIF